MCSYSSMLALDYRQAIAESEAVLRTHLAKAHAALIYRRLCFLLLLKTTPGFSRAKAGRQVGLAPTGSEEVWKLYKKGGLPLLMAYPFKGRASTLSTQDKAWLKEDFTKTPALTLAEGAKRIQKHTGTKKPLTPQAVHYIFKALKIKKKTGRPAHIHKDEAKVAAFKKKTSRL